MSRGIEWCDRSDWNPIRGCTRVSEGCRNCYAEAIAARFCDPGQPWHSYATRTSQGPRWTGKVALIEDRLRLPLSWRKPARIFVNSASDLFHDDVSFEALDRIFAIMALAPRHRFLILTKRPENMGRYIRQRLTDHADALQRGARKAGCTLLDAKHCRSASWPLPNVGLGASIENQDSANARVPHLLDTPAALRFLSVEPLLGPVDLQQICLLPRRPGSIRAGIHVDCLAGRYFESGIPFTDVQSSRAKIHWIIAGGESGPHARPAHPEWFYDIRDACVAAGIPFFFKQWGEWCPMLDWDSISPRLRAADFREGEWIFSTTNADWRAGFEADDFDTYRIGRRLSGHFLEGKEWRQLPAGWP